jgi:hypothetical protein
MAAPIEFVCIASHDSRSDPAITLEQRAWAYCAAGAMNGHQWTRIDPTAVETLRSRPGNGNGNGNGVHLIAEKSDEASLTSRPAR